MSDSSRLNIIDYGQSHCIPCGGWCCFNENPFLSKKDSQLIGKERLENSSTGACEFFKDGICTIYKIRPFECIIFPFDIMRLEGVLTWVLWQSCPAHTIVDPDSYLQLYEQSIIPNLEPNFLNQYVDYHLSHQPEKYTAHSFSILRSISL